MTHSSPACLIELNLFLKILHEYSRFILNFAQPVCDLFLILETLHISEFALFLKANTFAPELHPYSADIFISSAVLLQCFLNLLRTHGTNKVEWLLFAVGMWNE